MFSLKQYITELYLTEKLLSDTLVNELLHDKGHMFSYYKMRYAGSTYDKAYECFKELKYIITCVFNWHDEMKPRVEYEHEIIDTPEGFKALHKKYMDLYNKYINYTSKLFLKPEPNILSTLASGTIGYGLYFTQGKTDLYNITDEHFYKYTLAEIKKDKSIKDKIAHDIKQPLNLAFWLNNEGKILVVSRANRLILYSIDNKLPGASLGRRYFDDSSDEYINDKVKKENLTINNLTGVLSDGTELNWPTVSADSHIGDKHGSYGIDFIELNLSLSTSKSSREDGRNLLDVGSFTSKASKLLKYTDWGKNVNDYVIVYTPEQIYKDSEHQSTYKHGTGHYMMSTDNSYNDMKSRSEYNPVKYLSHRDFMEIQENTYKWIKDIFGKYKPYAGGKLSEYFLFGKKLENYDYEKLYGNDNYCSRLAFINITRYKNIIEKNKSLVKITNFNDLLKQILSQLNTYAESGKIICNEIKDVIKTDRERFKVLISLYGTYQKILNQCLNLYGTIQKDINALKLKCIGEYNLDPQLVERIKNDKKSIDNKIENTLKICDELHEFYDKIKELKDE